MLNTVRNIVVLGGLYGSGTPAGDYLGNEPAGLSIDFAQNSALVRGHTTNFNGTPQNQLTVVRASTATYFDSAGVIQTASNNILRLDYNPATLAALGVLVEEQRSNLIVQSNNFATTWAANSASGAQNTTGIDGLTSAWTLTDAAGGALGFYSQTVNGITVATYTFSAVFKKTIGATTFPSLSVFGITGTRRAGCTVDTNNRTATAWTTFTGATILTSSAVVQLIGADKFRVSLTFLPTTAEGHAFSVVIAGHASVSTTGDFNNALTGTCVVETIQVELGAF